MQRLPGAIGIIHQGKHPVTAIGLKDLALILKVIDRFQATGNIIGQQTDGASGCDRRQMTVPDTIISDALLNVFR